MLLLRAPEKLEATALCREGVYNRITMPSVTFWERGGATKCSECLPRLADETQRSLLRRGVRVSRRAVAAV